MDNYIKGNKEAWEEAFDMRQEGFDSCVAELVSRGDYSFFGDDMKTVLKRHDLSGKTIGQFCCNNGRELMSLVKTVGAAEGIGFDIAENMVSFANRTSAELALPCRFEAVNILDIGDEYAGRLDAVIITIGALCWFKSLKDYFAVVSKCMKKDGIIIINEAHPMTNMLAQPGEEEYDDEHPMNFAFSYFSHEWIGNGGMYYITGKSYDSKTFTDYTHSVSDIIGSMCANGMVVTDMREFDYDISEGFAYLDGKGLPLSMIIEARKANG